MSSILFDLLFKKQHKLQEVEEPEDQIFEQAHQIWENLNHQQCWDIETKVGLMEQDGEIDNKVAEWVKRIDQHEQKLGSEW